MAQFGTDEEKTLALSISVLAIVLALVLIRTLPPSAKGNETPPEAFSAGRARTILGDLVGNGLPHPVGSKANVELRHRIMDHILALGLKPELQTGFVCNRWGSCAEVTNILTQAPGTEGEAILVAAHYDSVPAGPGAADDGAGVAAALEIARAVRAGPALRRNVLFLIDEGEEVGLLGAELFTSRNPLAKKVLAAVNLEARGISGPSIMFETGTDAQALMRVYSRSVVRPKTSSLYYEIYKHLPNGTDFSVFKEAGYQGFGLAFIGGVNLYHSREDTFANVSSESQQHQGDTALALIRALANADFGAAQKRDAVYFDVASLWTFSWAADWSFGLALVGAVLLGSGVFVLVHRGTLSLAALLWGIISWPTMLLATAVTGFAIFLVFQKLGYLPINWVAHPVPLLVMSWSVGFLIVSLLAIFFGARAGYWGMWSGTWCCWSIVALVLAKVMPAASYLFLVPSLIASLCLVVQQAGFPRSKIAREAITLLPLIAASLIGISTIAPFYDALGAAYLALNAVFVSVILTPVAPLLGAVKTSSRWLLPSSSLATVVVAAMAVCVLPFYSGRAPQKLSLFYYQSPEPAGGTWVAYGEAAQLPQQIRQVGDFQRARPFPWSDSDAYVAKATDLSLPLPEVQVLDRKSENASVSYRLLLRSVRDAPELTVLFSRNSDIKAISIVGQANQTINVPLDELSDHWMRLTCHTMQPQGLEFAFNTSNSTPVDIWVIDRSFGLLESGMFFRKADGGMTVPFQDGDAALAARHIRLPDFVK